jgi:ABC-type multidrug transport system permease subunit
MRNKFYRVMSILLSSVLLFWGASVILMVNDIENPLGIWGFGILIFCVFLVMIKAMWTFYE